MKTRRDTDVSNEYRPVFYIIPVIYFIPIIGWSFCAAAAPTNQPADGILADSLASIQFPPPRYYCHLETEDRYDFLLSRYNISGETVSSTIFYDGTRFDGEVLSSRMYGATTRPYSELRGISDGKQYLVRQDDPNFPSHVHVFVITEPMIINRLNVIASHLYIDGCSERAGNRPMAAILRDSGRAKVTGEEVVGTSPCCIVEGKTPYGYYKLWLDQRNGFRFVKAMISMGPGDDLGGRRGRLPDKIDSIIGIDTTIENISYAQVGKYILANSGLITDKTHFADGHSNVERITKRRDIQIDPDFEKSKAFVMDGIPNGTSVNVNYDDKTPPDPFPYIWRDGHIIKDDDAATTDQMDKNIAKEKGATD